MKREKKAPPEMKWSDDLRAYVIAKLAYISGEDRNDPRAKAHLYRGTFERPRGPMCRRGWNRLNGFGWSIFRNNLGSGVCKVCLRRALH
jgi:hypothetical protein